MSDVLQAQIFILNKVIPDIYWADVLDIVIISFLLYWFLILFKQTRSSFVFLGMLILGAIYFLAEFFNLALTLTIFKIFFSVIVIGLIIIFQKELRRFFEMIVFEFISLGGSWRRLKAVHKIAPEYIENIVHSVERFAQQKIGMLIIIQGRENIDYHLQGGFELDGKISEPLLQSIFDPSTPGHDGAVIIVGDKITKFAAHLPLSENFQQIKQYGTRHSAGLGIAEKTDALSIIVSEEKGSIAVARDGQLKIISENGQLENEIVNFLNQKFTNKKVESFFEKNIEDKIVACLIALLLWYLVVYQLR